MMFTHCTSQEEGEVLEEVFNEKPDVVVSDMPFDEAEKLYLTYHLKTRKPLIWIQVPSLKVTNNDDSKNQYTAIFKKVLAPYHLSKTFVNDAVKLYRITEFLKKENG
ncbi:MAG: hypothetical protein GC193_13850 [Cryomorphaceae bacterium]|nr:hypothetical protein [Cryomorphaceae bacterium]